MEKALNIIKAPVRRRIDVALDRQIKKLFENLDIAPIEEAVRLAEEQLETVFSDREKSTGGISGELYRYQKCSSADQKFISLMLLLEVLFSCWTMSLLIQKKYKTCPFFQALLYEATR